MCKFQVSTRVIPPDAPSTESIGSRPFLGTRLFTASWGEFVFFFRGVANVLNQTFSSKMALITMAFGAVLFSLQYPDFSANGVRHVSVGHETVMDSLVWEEEGSKHHKHITKHTQIGLLSIRCALCPASSKLPFFMPYLGPSVTSTLGIKFEHELN